MGDEDVAESNNMNPEKNRSQNDLNAGHAGNGLSKKLGFIAKLTTWVEDKSDEIKDRQFPEAVAVVSRDRIDVNLTNRGPLRSRILIQHIFKSAQRDADTRDVNHIDSSDGGVCWTYIFTGTLSQYGTEEFDGVGIYAWSPLIQAAQDFLRMPGTGLFIISERLVDGGVDHPLLNNLNCDEQRLGELIVYQVDDPNFLGQQTEHFMVSGNAWRFELDDIEKIAVANFNNAKIGKGLQHRFRRFLRNFEEQPNTFHVLLDTNSQSSE